MLVTLVFLPYLLYEDLIQPSSSSFLMSFQFSLPLYYCTRVGNSVKLRKMHTHLSSTSRLYYLQFPNCTFDYPTHFHPKTFPCFPSCHAIYDRLTINEITNSFFKSKACVCLVLGLHLQCSLVKEI